MELIFSYSFLIYNKMSLIDQIRNSHKNKEQDEYTAKAGNFFGFLFSAANQAHKIHLATGRISKHLALEEFYTEVRSITDELVEVYQGCYEKIIPINFQEITLTEPLEFVSYVKSYIKANRKEVQGEETHIANIIDEIMAITDRTLYKIKFLQ